MKKIFFVIAAGALMLVSCGKMSPEAQKAWNNFKEASAKFESEEAVDANFNTAEEYSEGLKAWSEATQKLKDYTTEFSTEQADSMEKIVAKCKPVIEKMNAMMQQAAAQGITEEDVAEEGAAEEEATEE